VSLSEAFDKVHTFIIEELENRERSMLPASETDAGYIESARAAERAIAEAREMSQLLLEACKMAKFHLQPDLVEPGRTVFWKMVDVINKAEGK
jgi:hypothetical protein